MPECAAHAKCVAVAGGWLFNKNCDFNDLIINDIYNSGENVITML